ncbi:antibiotic biosynthesis monooxygenase family protein [Nocardia sp. NPDC059240]|uniref:antibiotic biosynthesis monooxygenase family protein n=1 Tax=Nocardia sp. NPDC059240 TaxID=3346786 RepID=UPI00368A5D31
MTDTGITLIDALELPENRIDESIADWQQRVALIHTAPGFRDARLHRRLSPESRLGLVAVAHWDSLEAHDKALADHGLTASEVVAPGNAEVRSGRYGVAAEFHSTTGNSGEGPGITFVNAFEIPADRIDDFLPNWRDRAQHMSTAPGFRANRLHRALDPTTHFPLVNIAQWDTPEAWIAATNDPRFQQRLTAAPTFATANPALFALVAQY